MNTKLTDEKIDAILSALDDVAREYDHYEYGLPMHSGFEGEDSPLDKMRAIFRAAIEAEVLSGASGAEGVKCSRCNGSGVVDDGEIDCHSNGEPFENGSIKCVKDCPACGGRAASPAAPVPPAACPHVFDGGCAHPSGNCDGFLCAAMPPADGGMEQSLTFAKWWARERNTARSRQPGDDWLDLSEDDKEQYRACWEAAAQSYSGAAPLPPAGEPVAPDAEKHATLKITLDYEDGDGPLTITCHGTEFDMLALDARLKFLHKLEDATPSAGVQAEGKLMPPEPTPEMVAALVEAAELEQADPEDPRYDDGCESAIAIYKALFKATPSGISGATEPTSQGDADGVRASEVDRLRAEQAAGVMPQIGPLLDAWDGMDNDTKATLREDAPDLANALSAISRAMDGTDGVGTPDGGQK